MRKYTKILAAILSLAMLITAIGITSASAETVKVSRLFAAIEEDLGIDGDEGEIDPWFPDFSEIEGGEALVAAMDNWTGAMFGLGEVMANPDATANDIKEAVGSFKAANADLLKAIEEIPAGSLNAEQQAYMNEFIKEIKILDKVANEKFISSLQKCTIALQAISEYSEDEQQFAADCQAYRAAYNELKPIMNDMINDIMAELNLSAEEQEAMKAGTSQMDIIYKLAANPKSLSADIRVGEEILALIDELPIADDDSDNYFDFKRFIAEDKENAQKIVDLYDTLSDDYKTLLNETFSLDMNVEELTEYLAKNSTTKPTGTKTPDTTKTPETTNTKDEKDNPNTGYTVPAAMILMACAGVVLIGSKKKRV